MAETAAMYSMVTSIDLNMDNSALTSMMSVYDLSEAEANVALQISEGVAPGKIAKNRDVSVNTIRTQMRTIFAKTETKGIPDLVRLLCSFIASHAVVGSPAGLKQALVKSADHTRRGSIELPDGRTLSYHEQGAPNGRPILFFHSIIYGPLMTDQAAESCVRAGFRIIAPSMPGYGESSPNPNIEGEDLIKATQNPSELDSKALQHPDVLDVVVDGIKHGLYKGWKRFASIARYRSPTGCTMPMISIFL